ncbi:MAG: SapC family protein [Gammaproteobacteria bacterium]
MSVSTGQFQLYKNIVPLTRENHGHLYIERIDNFAYTRDTNTVYVFCMEFMRVAKEYPIIFNMKTDEIYPVALLGLQNGVNEFLDKDANWIGEYVPCYVRRYPFILIKNPEDGKAIIGIDDDYPGLNKRGRGVPLFGQVEDGPMLTEVKDFCRKFQTHIDRTTQFCKKMQELDLLVPMRIDDSEVGGKVDIDGYAVVERQRIWDLEDDVLLDLMKSDTMELLYMHLFSIGLLYTYKERYL